LEWGSKNRKGGVILAGLYKNLKKTNTRKRRREAKIPEDTLSHVEDRRRYLKIPEDTLSHVFFACDRQAFHC
jgi:hypothetical protein